MSCSKFSDKTFSVYKNDHPLSPPSRWNANESPSKLWKRAWNLFFLYVTKKWVPSVSIIVDCTTCTSHHFSLHKPTKLENSLKRWRSVLNTSFHDPEEASRDCCCEGSRRILLQSPSTCLQRRLHTISSSAKSLAFCETLERRPNSCTER